MCLKMAQRMLKISSPEPTRQRPAILCKTADLTLKILLSSNLARVRTSLKQWLLGLTKTKISRQKQMMRAAPYDHDSAAATETGQIVQAEGRPKDADPEADPETDATFDGEDQARTLKAIMEGRKAP